MFAKPEGRRFQEEFGPFNKKNYLFAIIYLFQQVSPDVD